MQHSVFRQTLCETRQPMLRWVMVMVGAVWISLLAHPLLVWVSGGQLWQDRFPAWLTFLLAGQTDLSSIHNWSQTITLGIVLPAAITISSVFEGSWLVAGEEERGSLGLLLATPLRRYSLVLQKFAVLFILVIVCSAGTWLAISLVSWVGILSLSSADTFGAVLALFSLGMVTGGSALALGSLTGRYRLSRNIMLLYGLLIFGVSRVPSGFPGSMLARWISPYSFYFLALLRVDYWINIFLLLFFALVSLGTAWIGFEKRDLPV